MYFPNYGPVNKRLDKWLKKAVSQSPLTSNMFIALKHTSNHRRGTYIKLIDYR